MCAKHKRSIWGNEAGFNLVTGTLTNIFSGAATVVTGGTGQAALAALALFSNAERSLGNEAVYKNMLIHAIVQKINERRAGLKNTITNEIISNASNNYYAYPINVAIIDVLDYHHACSFMSGLQLAIKEGTSDKKPQKITKLKNLLHSLSLQLDSRKNHLNDDSKVKDDPQHKSLLDRYNTAANSLKALENEASVTPQTQKPEG